MITLLQLCRRVSPQRPGLSQNQSCNIGDSILFSVFYFLAKVKSRAEVTEAMVCKLLMYNLIPILQNSCLRILCKHPGRIPFSVLIPGLPSKIIPSLFFTSTILFEKGNRKSAACNQQS